MVLNSNGNGAAASAMTCLGICCLLPYNCLLSSQNYFNQYLFPGMNFSFASMVAYSLMLCLGQIMLTWKGHLISIRGRVQVAFAFRLGVCVLLGAVAAVPQFRDTGSHEIAFIVCLCTIALLGSSDALLQSAIFGVAGSMGEELAGAVMVGLGVAGITSLVVSLLVLSGEMVLGINDGVTRGMLVTMMLFGITFLYTLASMWIYFVFLSVRVSESATAIAQLEQRREDMKERTTQKGQDMRAPLAPVVLDTDLQVATDCAGALTAEDVGRCRALAAQDVHREEGSVGTTSTSSEVRAKPPVLPILKAIAPQAFNIWLTFCVSLSLFPGVVSQWEPGANSMFQTNRTLFSTLLIGCFQVFDVLSRMAAGWGIRHIKPRALVCFVLLRLAFIPVFVLGQRHPDWCPLWGSDLGRFFLCSLMAFSNGLFGSCAMMFGPSHCREDWREVAGVAMSCTMVIGIFTGSLLAPLTQV
eukprot:TRINITY_DN14951_c0_g1_i1.p1 TRINITY_DN14951_c0_g1~~TRINITY_DN14951_c0_g1_i1.p1  ORF type:complete len:470 (+),score=69.06 TRINITY_DN14951_c0_g1_i1:53-1462(+)